MPSPIVYLVIHCTASAYGKNLTPDDIHKMHKGLKFEGGVYHFNGKTYKTKEELKGVYLTLPSGAKVEALKTNGRGWGQVGYSDMIDWNGKLINLVPYNNDNIVDPWEVTNGVANMNSKCRHIVMVGGFSKDGRQNGHNEKGQWYKPEELYTPQAVETLKKYVRDMRVKSPKTEITGHNKLAAKTCPNFDVKEFISRI